MRFLQFANASGSSRSIENRGGCLLTSHIALGQHQALGTPFLSCILSWAIVCLKWYVRRSNQIVVLNWLRFESSSKQWLEPKIKLVVQRDSQASHLSFQDQTLLNSGKTLAWTLKIFPVSTLQVSNNSPLEFGRKNTTFLLNDGAIEYFI